MGEWAELTTAITGVITALAIGLWRGYRAIERQAYERVRAETRLTKAEETIDQLKAERRRLDGVIQDLQHRLDWWELEEAPRLHDRIQALDEHLAACTADLEGRS